LTDSTNNLISRDRRGLRGGSSAILTPRGFRMVALAKVYQLGQSRDETRELFDIVRDRSYRYGRYTLSSGAESNIYFNMKPTMLHPRGGWLSARAFLAMLRETKTEWIGGLEMGAVPVIGTMVGLGTEYDAPVNAVFVRKAPKAHGTKEVIEGLAPNETLKGRAVFVVDDVATSGKSILKAVEAIRSAGGIVKHAGCIVDRDEGATQFLGQEGVLLHSILHAHDFLEPAKPLIEGLRGSPPFGDLPSACADCRVLAERSDCPCPSHLYIAQLVLASLFDRLEAQGFLSEQQLVRYNDCTAYIASQIEVAASGLVPDWADLHRLSQRVLASDAPTH
jgi:orotate phosphoribosyltransferase